jgi:hypothetical protein
MGNHFHLVVETPQANLVSGMKWFLGTYTNRFNRRHRVTGHLFAGRYKSLLVEGSGDGYLRTVCDYVHLNPSRAGLISPEQRLRDYRWSSFEVYLRPPEQRPNWFRVDRLFGEMGIARDNPPGRREFEAQTEARRAAENSDDWRLLRRGWCYGNREFRRRLLDQIESTPQARFPEPRRISAQEKAEDVIAEELARRHWTQADLATRLKGDPEKVQIARRLRRETTVTLKWVASRLHMGAWTYLANSLYATEGKLPSQATQPAGRDPRRAKRVAVRKSEREADEPPKRESNVPSALHPPDDATQNSAPSSPSPSVGVIDEVLPLHCL